MHFIGRFQHTITNNNCVILPAAAALLFFDSAYAPSHGARLLRSQMESHPRHSGSYFPDWIAGQVELKEPMIQSTGQDMNLMVSSLGVTVAEILLEPSAWGNGREVVPIAKFPLGEELFEVFFEIFEHGQRLPLGPATATTLTLLVKFWQEIVLRRERNDGYYVVI